MDQVRRTLQAQRTTSQVPTACGAQGHPTEVQPLVGSSATRGKAAALACVRPGRADKSKVPCGSVAHTSEAAQLLARQVRRVQGAPLLATSSRLGNPLRASGDAQGA